MWSSKFLITAIEIIQFLEQRFERQSVTDVRIMLIGFLNHFQITDNVDPGS